MPLLDASCEVQRFLFLSLSKLTISKRPSRPIIFFETSTLLNDLIGTLAKAPSTSENKEDSSDESKAWLKACAYAIRTKSSSSISRVTLAVIEFLYSTPTVMKYRYDLILPWT